MVHDDGRVVYDVTEVPDDAQMIYWVLTSIKEDFVPKDPKWLSDHLPALKEFWGAVLEHRTNGTRPVSELKQLPTLDL
jgi:ABC-type nitrate/sulfonate/bicarbonate transport system substrate-binding protein